MAAFIAIVVSAELGASTLRQATHHTFVEAGRAMTNAKGVPVAMTVQPCIHSGQDIVCAITLAPRQYQDYVIFGKWAGRVEGSPNDDGKNVSLSETKWHPTETSKSAIPVTKVTGRQFIDLEIRTSLKEACEMQRTREAHDGHSHIFFQADARTQIHDQTTRTVVRMIPENEADFRTELEQICQPERG